MRQRYLPEGLAPGAFFHPSPRGWESWRLEASARDRQDLEDAEGPTDGPTEGTHGGKPTANG